MSSTGWLPEHLIADFETAEKGQEVRVRSLFAALEAAATRAPDTGHERP